MKSVRAGLLLSAALCCHCASDSGGETGPAAGASAGGAAQASGAQAGHSGSGGDGSAAVDCTKAPQYAEVAAFHKCTMCHSSERSAAERSGAPAAINFDSEETANTYAQAAQRVVSGGIMPPKSSGITLTDQEKQQLLAWATCRAQSE